jgi:hypothetical protein
MHRDNPHRPSRRPAFDGLPRPILDRSSCGAKLRRLRAQRTTLTWFGRFVGPAGHFPPGCPVIDPVAQSANFPPYATFASSLGYTVPAACTAIKLRVTASFSEGGAVVAQRSAFLIITQPSAT